MFRCGHDNIINCIPEYLLYQYLEDSRFVAKPKGHYWIFVLSLYIINNVLKVSLGLPEFDEI